MKDQKLSTILSVISMICGILAPCLVCYWYVGMVFAVAAIVLGIYVQKHFGKSYGRDGLYMRRRVSGIFYFTCRDHGHIL